MMLVTALSMIHIINTNDNKEVMVFMVLFSVSMIDFLLCAGLSRGDEGGNLHFVTIFCFSDGNSFKYVELGAIEGGFISFHPDIKQCQTESIKIVKF